MAWRISSPTATSRDRNLRNDFLSFSTASFLPPPATTAKRATATSRLRDVVAGVAEGPAAFHALLLSAILLDARRLIAWARPDGASTIYETFERVNYLTLAEWCVILAFAARSSLASFNAGKSGAAAGFAFALGALFFTDPRSLAPTAVLCLALAGRLATDRRQWPLCFCLVVMAAQWRLNMFVTGDVDRASIFLDVRGTRFLLLASGYATEIQGALLKMPGLNHVIEILPGCDTLRALPAAIGAYAIFATATARRLDARFILPLAGLVSAIFISNWLRLAAMIWSREAFEYWHNGAGAALVSSGHATFAWGFARMAAASATRRFAKAA